MQLIKKDINFIDYKFIKELNEEDIIRLNKLFKYDYYLSSFKKIKNIIYHVKENYLEEAFINELLGQIICEYFGAEIIKSRIMRTENSCYLVTENFLKEGHKYTTLKSGIFTNFDFSYCSEEADLFSLNDLNFIRDGSKVLKTDKKDLEKLKYDLKLMIVSDYIRNQVDRVFRNFMFEYNKNHVRLMPLYDFEHSFLNVRDTLYNTFNLDFEDEKIKDYIRYDNVFQELLYKAVDLDMKKIFEQLFDEYPVRLNKKEIYWYESIVDDKQQDIKNYKLLR